MLARHQPRKIPALRRRGAWSLRRILLPVDLSPESLKALRYGSALACRFGAAVTLLHVVPDALPADISHLAVVLHSRRLAADARVRLARWVAAIRTTGLKTRAVVRTGNPLVEICRYANATRTDVIVLSTHGYNGLKHLWLGSTTERVVRHAPCPVLVVRLHEREFVPLSGFNPT